MACSSEEPNSDGHAKIVFTYNATVFGAGMSCRQSSGTRAASTELNEGAAQLDRKDFD